MVDGQKVGDSLLDLLLTSKEELDRDMINNSSRGCSDYKEPQMWQEWRWAVEHKPEASGEETLALKLGHYSLNNQTIRRIRGCLDDQTKRTVNMVWSPGCQWQVQYKGAYPRACPLLHQLPGGCLTTFAEDIKLDGPINML